MLVNSLSWSARYLAAEVVVVCLFLFCPVHAAAQSSRLGATLEGTLSDSSSAVLPQAAITLRNTSTNQSRTVTTDEQGFFRAEQLPVGTYEVRVERPGFTQYRHTGVVLSLGQTLHLEIVLAPSSTSAEVTVSAQPSAIDTSQTSVVSSVDQERIEELPVRSRNYLDFVLLAPGVSSSPTALPVSGATPLSGSGFTFGGLRSRSNNVSIDGLDNNDEYTGSSRLELSPEIVQEFQVVNNGLSAESGGASGGSVNVITRSGTNTMHGDAFLFAQDSAFNARDAFETKLELFLKTDAGRRDVDLCPKLATLLKAYVGDRSSGFLFQNRKGSFLSQTNLLRRGLHPALEKLKQPKAGFHAFRRYRLTWLRKNRVHADLERFWMGHENETVGDGYSKMKEDVAFRLEQAAKVGLGFALPPKATDVARIARKNEAKPEVENAA
jgi:Carboxypeptidase regulatory-like domain/TonB-dependent Receptor Plug Domain